MPASSSLNITAVEKMLLLKLARDTLINSFGTHQMPPLPEEGADSIFNLTLGCFVTLTLDGELNGCMGCIDGDRPLRQSIPDLATSSAFYDRRFSPLTEAQLEQVSIEISLLSPLTPLMVHNQAQLEAHLAREQVGLVLSEGEARAVFLPQVWQQLPKPKTFIEALKNKAGWPVNYWSNDIKVEVFTVIHFSEKR